MNQVKFMIRNLPKFIAPLIIFALALSIPFSHANESTEIEGNSRTIVQKLEDTGITYRIQNYIKRNKEVAKTSNVNVTTVNDIVLLTGTVETAEHKQWVEDLSYNHPHVREVVNELRVTKYRSFFQMTKDKLLQVAIRAKLANHFRPKTIPVNVVVSFEIVYLMGAVTPEIAEKAVEIAQNQKSVDRVITIFEVSQTG